jgi:hypothetical protein
MGILGALSVFISSIGLLNNSNIKETPLIKNQPFKISSNNITS